MRRIRSIFFWLHLIVGLTIGLFIASMAGSGLIMVFERQITDFAERGDGTAPAGVTERLDVETLLTRAREARPDDKLGAITLSADRTATASVLLGRDRRVQLNAYTGNVVGSEAVNLRAFFHTVEEFHRWLAMTGPWKDRGRLVTGATSLGFVGLIVSGLYLWLPRTLRWNSFKPILLFNFRLRGKARDWNWHNVVGVWLLVPMLVVALTGVIMSYDWANRLLFAAVGDAPPPARERQSTTQPSPEARAAPQGGERRRAPAANFDGLNDLWAVAERQAGKWTTITMQLSGGRGRGTGAGARGPGTGGATSLSSSPEPGTRTPDPTRAAGVTFIINRGDPASPIDRTTLVLNRRTGETIRTETLASQTPGRAARSLVLPIHRGEILALPTQIVAAVTCCGAMLLVYTGFALSWRRFFGRSRRRAVMHAAETAETSADFATSAV